MVIVIESMRNRILNDVCARSLAKPIRLNINESTDNGANANATRIDRRKIQGNQERERREKKLNNQNTRALNTVGHNFIEMKILMS